jgi:restriction system protein
MRPSDIEIQMLGLNRYCAEVTHPELGKQRRVTASDPETVRQRAAHQLAQWDEQWKRQLEKEREQRDRSRKKEVAARRTAEAEAVVDALHTLLVTALPAKHAVDWETLKDQKAFSKPKPSKRAVAPPKPPPFLPEPRHTDPVFRPRIGLAESLLPGYKRRAIAGATARFQAARAQWVRAKELAQKAAAQDQELYRSALRIAEQEHEKAIRAWEAERGRFEQSRAKRNASVDGLKTAYLGGAVSALRRYCQLVLTRSSYPIAFHREFEFEYRRDPKMLIVDYRLPAPTELPKISEVRYIQAHDETKEVELSDSAFNKLYDNVLYQMALRTIHELFASDVISALQSVVFNGWVHSIDPATGKKVVACVLSVSAQRDEFRQLDLARVEPKACFTALKGVGSAKLHALSPIAPVVRMSREDPRFVSSYDVAETLDRGTNIAAISWEDFEHLVRELFEKEFATTGGEVKVTRASRDHGVDAVAFDPDPIRGGKIVIQAKRYTNTVGVSAVRDLYGTVLNEGATKGILVTTSEYGPDAYDFARGKPLTLLNGSNLLHLLAKHGHPARIDLREAKQILADQEAAEREA